MIDDANDARAAAMTDEPLVSILVRSMDRPQLGDALASVALQTYPRIEVVVVSARGACHRPLPTNCGRFPLRMVQPERPLARAEAANCALAHARGDWVLFLDDDDLLDAEHVRRLRDALATHPQERLAYGGVRLVDAAGKVLGVIDEDFDAGRLWLANYLPIHAVMFARTLVDELGGFDETLDVYEDWDFWLRLSRHHHFIHVPGVSASYRQLGTSGLTAGPDAALTLRARRALYDKWLGSLGAEQLEAIMRVAELARARAREAGEIQADLRQRLEASGRHRDALASAADEVNRALVEARAAADAVRRELAGRESDLHAARTRIAQLEQMALRAQESAAAERQARDALRQTSEAARRDHLAALEKSSAELRASLTEYARLEAGYLQVMASWSWRVTAPMRRLRSLISADSRRLMARDLFRALPLQASTRQRLKVALASRPWGGSLLRWLQASSSAPTAVAPHSLQLDKDAVRRQAESDLTDFLAGTSRLTLGQGTGTPTISVIVVIYNQAGLSLLCLKALAASRGIGFETLIVDNASDDRVPQLLARVDGAQVQREASNLGFLRAVNRAAIHARGEYLLLLNNDALVERDTLRLAAQRLAMDATAGAVGGPILLWDGHLQEAGSIVWRDGSCVGYGRGDLPDRPMYRFVRDVDYCSGAFLMVRKALFEQLGGLDDVYAPAYYEETDFCMRLWQAGHRVVYDPALRVRHFEFASEGGAGQGIELQQRNRARFVERHASALATHLLPDGEPGTLLKARMRLRAGALRVLVIDDRVPLPWLGQGYPRAAALVAALVRGGHFVTHFPLQFPHESAGDVARALPQAVEVMLDVGLAGLAGFMRERRGCYDVVVVSRPHNMDIVRRTLQSELGWLSDVRLVYDAEALFSLRELAKAALSGRPLPVHEQQAQIDAELELARGADVIVAVSEAEAAHYRQAGHRDVVVLGHVVPAQPTATAFGQRHGFLFVGALPADDTPNADSMIWFVQQVWPTLLRKLGTQSELHIVGACDAPALKALAGGPIHLHGAVTALEPYFAAARVFVVPTRYAAGMPYKAHEAAAHGLPMVVTPLIAEQLGWAGWVTQGADADAFAAACLRLHEDEAAWLAARDAQLRAVAHDCDDAVFARGVQAVLGLLPAAGPEPDPESRSRAESKSEHVVLSPDVHRTADLWARDAVQRLDAGNALRHWASHPVTAREINRAISGDPECGWIAHLRRSHFPVPGERGVSLGCGGGAAVVDVVGLEIVRSMEGLDIAEGAIELARRRAKEAGLDHRARFRVVDLNQVTLQGPYDLILFEQSLHHVEALESLLDRCRDALAVGGRLVINEYVGPDRFQWSDEVERLMNAMLVLLPESMRCDPRGGPMKAKVQRTPPEQVIAIDPSEAIHSSRILAACAERFELVERRDFGGTLLQFLLAEIAANFDPADELDAALLRLMALMERELISAGALASDFVFAVYRRGDGGA